MGGALNLSHFRCRDAGCLKDLDSLDVAVHAPVYHSAGSGVDNALGAHEARGVGYVDDFVPDPVVAVEEGVFFGVEATAAALSLWIITSVWATTKIAVKTHRENMTIVWRGNNAPDLKSLASAPPFANSLRN